MSSVVDLAGMLVSTLCLLHCLAFPLLVAVLPALGGGEDMHPSLFGAAALAALTAFAPGYLAHGRLLVPLLGAAGLVLLATAIFFVGPTYGEVAETWCSVAGAGLLGAAHLRNRVCCRDCSIECLVAGPCR